jgi:hypothetical protein
MNGWSSLTNLPVATPASYFSAKIVLIGESSVGKIVPGAANAHEPTIGCSICDSRVLIGKSAEDVRAAIQQELIALKTSINRVK